MLRSINTFKHLKRFLSIKPSVPILESLNERTLIKISGNNISDYLQGLITNDVQHLDKRSNCMYTMFLNTKGRVLFDAIVYKTIEDNTFLVECDVKIMESLKKHLKIYKLRKKIDIVDLKNEYSLYVIFNAADLKIKEFDLFNKNVDNVFSDLNRSIKTSKTVETFNDIHIYRDPRMVFLGYRIIAPKDKNVKQELSNFVTLTEPTNDITYKWFRYNLGIGEGTNDLPPENCFPLEANCDYLHGVSFHKGCYVGQELTARTFHTGVVRKRLMPLMFTKIPTVTPDTNIIVNNVKLGKLRGIEGGAGLALLRVAQSLDAKNIYVGDGLATTLKPIWWPIEVSKEKISTQKS